MTSEESAAALKFYDILQEKVKTYVEGSPKDLFFYHDKNSGSWEDFRRKAVCAFAVMLRKDYTTSQMITQFLPPRTPRKSIESHRPNGTPITTFALRIGFGSSILWGIRRGLPISHSAAHSSIFAQMRSST